MVDLSNRTTTKLPSDVRLSGRILYLTEDPHLVRRQLAGDDLLFDSNDPAHALRDNISTDEITPGWVCYYFDETLGKFVYVGLTCRDEKPIGEGEVAKGGFVASVAGKRRGKGSSREQSPYAERAAGIKLVVAENIERIYRQNCVNLGILTTTDFSVLEKVAKQESIPLSVFTEGQDAITKEIIEYGGLFEYNVARLQGKTVPPAVTTAPRPMTLAEKIFAKNMVADAKTGRLGVPAVEPGDAGFVRTDIRFSHEYVTPMAAAFWETFVGEDAKVTDPSSIFFFRDHLTFLDEVMPEAQRKRGLLEVAERLASKQSEFAAKQGVRLHGELAAATREERGSEAICHSKVYQDYALPGQIVVGSDSHTPHSGALACVAFGIGTTDVFNSWLTKDVRVKVPTTVRAVFKGIKPDEITAKDFMLALLAHPYVKNGEAIGKIVEYAGEAVEALSLDERATMTNMAAEVGAFTGIVAADEKTARYLAEQRGLPLEKARELCAGWVSDEGAEYETTITIDAAALAPMVALPGDPGNGVFIKDLAEDVPIEIAYGGSCTAGKREDMEMYATVLAEGLARGQRVAPGVTFWIQFGSQEVKEWCRTKGYLDVFAKAGAKLIEPSCGACIAAGPGVSTRPDQVTVSAINRNFPGRSGPGRMYLASPYVVAASALAGKIVEWRPAVVEAVR
ncbi:MAG TPA: aconitase family protein [Thermoanaerobaculia bacterium]|nr:aconitase family protein [Thermoanaerobaculia bacterium]